MALFKAVHRAKPNAYEKFDALLDGKTTNSDPEHYNISSGKVKIKVEGTGFEYTGAFGQGYATYGTIEKMSVYVSGTLYYKVKGLTHASAADVKATLKKKIDVDFKPYTILGACNPQFAYKALQAEDKIGTMLPWNVIVIGKGPDKTEVSAVDPAASMAAIDNPDLAAVAGPVRELLQDMVKGL